MNRLMAACSMCRQNELIGGRCPHCDEPCRIGVAQCSACHEGILKYDGGGPRTVV